MPSFVEAYLAETVRIVNSLDVDAIEACVEELACVRARGGRVFVLGNGGSAANAAHLVNDLRKMARIEAYAPTDNAAELTARTNDDGWATTFDRWLEVSRLDETDLIFVLSVGGGTRLSASPNLTNALGYASTRHAPIIGIVGRNGGFTAKMATACVLVPTECESRITPHAEETQSIVSHLFVSHPRLACR